MDFRKIVRNQTIVGIIIFFSVYHRNPPNRGQTKKHQMLNKVVHHPAMPFATVYHNYLDLYDFCLKVKRKIYAAHPFSGKERLVVQLKDLID